MIDYSMLGELDNKELLISKGIQAIEYLDMRINDPSEKNILQHAMIICQRELDTICKEEDVIISSNVTDL